MRKIAASLAAAFALGAPPTALASATFTYPVDGQTVSLDNGLNFDFRWTLPPGDTYPEVFVGNQPAFDPQNNFAPFDSWCGGQVDVASSCRSGLIPVAGPHYAVIATSPASGDNFAPDASPEIRFSVPYRIGLGCVPTVGCEWPRLANYWYPLGDSAYGYPYTRFNIWGWTNGPTLDMGYTLTHGRHVVKRWRHTLPANVYGDTPQPDHLEVVVYRLRGLAPGTPLRLTVTLRSGSATLTRTYTVHAGGGRKKGTTTLGET